MLLLYGSVAVTLARRLLTMEEGDRLDPIGQLAAEFETGRGTVQAALKLLIDEGALEVDALGKRGSFIKKLNREKLLQLGDLTSIIGVMPVAISTIHYGLSTGLHYAFEQTDIPLVLAQLRGAKNRLHFLRTGRCDFAIISRMSWLQEADKGDLLLLFGFGPGSNVANHALLMPRKHDNGIVDGMRVGVDPTSHDHFLMALKECEGKSVQFIEISYGESIPKLLSGNIDVSICSESIANLPSELKIVPLQYQEVHRDTNTEAVLVVRNNSKWIEDLIQNRIDPAFIATIQSNVVNGKEKPVF
ncbi:hypothetical protein CGZ75_03100 [Paenibacillus herberti]|uniref:HTH gntR-type domain-containing protein n=2 Tax=Paenibacillus herberti TaxID=1619309 RepID=A0A229P0S0_9BACL|nr:YhfZ family protein [Paenibacillus herberti]OXM15728.1 hypothetical protein CGZ75_03100 [Paenibacillus herberti]